MSIRVEDPTLAAYIQGLEDRIAALESSNIIRARSWNIKENDTGQLVFTHMNGRIVTINAIGANVTI